MERHVWTDERIDDMAEHHDNQFTLLREDLRAQREETRAEFRLVREETRAEFAAVHAELVAMRTDMHAGFMTLRRDMLIMAGGFITALVTLLAAAH